MQEMIVVEDAIAPCPVLRYGPCLGLYLHGNALLKGPAVLATFLAFVTEILALAEAVTRFLKLGNVFFPDGIMK